MTPSVVDVIAGLTPLNTCQHAAHPCALALLDGTLSPPVDQSHPPEQEEWVALAWQRNSRRRSEAIGSQMACLAAWRQVELQGAGRSATKHQALRQPLSEQFMRCTGRTLQPEFDLAALLA